VIGGSGSGGAGVGLSAWMLKSGEEKIMAERLVEVLRSHADETKLQETP
jgi:hypothetical protein